MKCRSDYAYGDSGQGTIPAGATLNFDVELVCFHDKKKEMWEYSAEEKVSEATKLKDAGNELFKMKNFEAAVKKYMDACEFLEDAATSEVKLSCQLNAAQAYINLGDYASASSQASAVLKVQPDNVKALFRRGVARIHMGSPEEALSDFNRVQELDPSNAPVKAEIVKAKKQIAEAHKKTKVSRQDDALERV